MNNLFGNNNTIKEYYEKEQDKMFQQQEKEEIGALKKYFKDKIKISFMFKVLKQIKKMANDYKVHFDAEFKLPEEFEKEYLKNGKDANKIAYLNYGWLASIFEFEYLGIKKSYNFSDVVKLVNQLIYKDRKIKNYASNLDIYYKKCHYHSHANLYCFRFSIIYIMDLCKGLGEVLLGIAYEINKIEKVDLFNGIDLVKNARMSVDRLHKMREDLTTEQLEKYYKNRN